MLVSNRFIKTPTKATQTRLAQLVDNSIPMTLRERNRGAVIAIQSALTDLNRGYLARSEVDGYFGSRTAIAVEMFQRDYGLYADGIVGKQTLIQLDQLFASDSFRRPQGFSIHVGVNEVDANHYKNTFPLAACENDARAFQSIASDLGYETLLLLTKEATTSSFIQAMRQAISNLFAGDALLITFSGHGSQLTNISDDNEEDFLDETLCFYDRMLLDDELYNLLSQLRPGVQVNAIYDSCHSGSVSKKIALLPISEQVKSTENQIIRSLQDSVVIRSLSGDPTITSSSTEEPEDKDHFKPISSKSLSKALDGEKPSYAESQVYNPKDITAAAEAVVAIEDALTTGKDRFIAFFSGVYEANRELYMAVQNAVGSQEQMNLDCNVVALSACQDNQTTADGVVNGLFTGNILLTWANGAFEGSYNQIHQRLVAQSNPNMTPILTTYGGPQAQARLYERPFVF